MFSHLLAGLRDSHTRQSKRDRRRSRRLAIETLEARRVMAASAVFSNGILTVTGGSGNDTIYLKNISSRVYVADGSLGNNVRIKSGTTTVTSLSVSSLTEIRVNAGGGNDTVRGDSGNFTGQSTIPVRMVLKGESGNDVLRSGSGNDFLYGGTGNDQLHGNSGNDWLYGDSNNDKLYGGSGNDRLYGGYGNDELFGHEGIDYLYGGADNDRLNGGEDKDYVSGGTGRDVFHRQLTANGFSLGGDPSPDSDETVDDPQQVAGAFLTDQSPPTSDAFWHIDQNDSPTCAFFASLAAVTRYTTSSTAASIGQRDLISRIRYNATDGSYTLPLYVGGAWKNFTLNGYWSESGMGFGPFWTSLYLKAYLMANNVKYYDAGNFATDPSTWTSSTGAAWKSATTAIRMLTGLPTAFYSLNSSSDPQDYANKLDAGRIYVASSKSSPLDNRIVKTHAYTVMNVFKAGSTWYLDLYNPWKHAAVNLTNYGSVSTPGYVRVTWTQYQQNFTGQTRNTN